MVEDADWYGETAYYLDNDVLVVSGYESYKSVANQTWITFLSTGSSSNTWDAAYMSFDSEGATSDDMMRYFGMSIRPVSE